MAVKLPSISYDLIFPDGKKLEREGEVIGWVKNRQQIVDRILHAFPGARVEKLLALDDNGKPLNPQPPELVQ